MNVEEIYKKKDLHKHILDRPDTYIGSTKKTNEEKFVFDEETQKIIKKEVEYTPAFIKIFDEILVNAIDHTVRDKTATTIKVSVEGDTISVMNTGAGVPAVMHSEYGVYIPELIFGQLLTSSNYDDTDQRIVGGVNGLGSKATNIYSKFFSVETVDAVNGVSYYQEFKDNMYKVSKPILKNSKKKPYTKITFTPDYTRFSMKGMTPDALSIIKKRTYDTSATTGKDVSVYFNDAKVPYKDFQQYTALYIQPSEDIPQVIYEKFVQDEVFVWEYAVFYDKQNNNGFNQVSFVNGINTYQGGKHVDAVVNQIIKKLGEMITSKKKVENLRPAYIKDKLFLFVKATVVNPSFSSQSKEYLSTPMKDFGSKPEVSDSFISKVYSKTGIVEDIVSFTKFKNQKELGKAGDAPSRKKSKLNIPNLEDAYNAGTSKSENCVLFLTEGMSAKTFAVSGLSVIGRENYGIYPLKGKCVSEDTSVLLWNGDVKLAKDICLGDELIGDDGNPRNVLTLFKDSGKMYEICQNKGDSYKVNEDHILTLCFPEHKSIQWCESSLLWKTLYWDDNEKKIMIKEFDTFIKVKCEICDELMNSKSSRRHYTRKHKNIPYIPKKHLVDENDTLVISALNRTKEFLEKIDDDNVFDIPIGKYMKMNNMHKRRLKGVRGQCVNWKEKNLSLDPYILGLWLGDGGSSGYDYTCDGDKDHEIIKYMETWGEKNDLRLKKTGKYNYSLSSIDNFRHKGKAPLKKLLETYGLVNNKHIPRDFLLNSKENRLKLLAGIIDTDGYVCMDGTVEISQGVIHEKLAKDIVYLSRSLGFFTRIRRKITNYTYRNSGDKAEAFIIKISGDISCIPTILPRKTTKSTSKYNVYNSTGYIKIKELSCSNYVGIGIDGNNRFLINDFTVTHNCLNIREATQKQLLNNEELNNLKQIIGLNHGKKYSDTKSLRYSKVCILTDADYDGSHIKGLIMNMFHYWWPELLDIKGFLTSMKTPMIKATSGSGKTAKEIDFYSMSAYNKWAGDNTSSKWNIKYYKGLGTSTATEAKKIFSNMKNNFVNYFSENKKSTDEAITLAFDKKMADKRKDWLKTYNFDSVLDQTEKDYSYDTFVNNELIHFSMYDVNRSIPSICDGMKPSQRKVLFTLFKRNFSKEIKVAQLGAAVAELTSYHHGEVSLFGTIINMAQDFPGSNNINLLEPNGQFGSRLALGKDAASPRYIFTELSKITKELFDPRDFEVLEYLQDDGASIEPRYYIPVIPMVLVNGCQGIGTGYSTSIPSFNPTDILENINRYLKGEKLKKMTPWFSGFTGKITPDSENDTNFIMTGVYSTSGDSVITITEIPVNTSIEDYKDFLEKIETVKDIKNSSTENKPHFIVKFESPKAMKEFLGEDPLKSLKLSKSISTRNYHLIDENGSIKKYESAEEILEQFMKIRLHTNELRKTSLIEKYSKELLILKNKINFLKSIMENKIDIYRKTKKDIEKILKETGFDTVDSTYNYLSSMPIFSFTKENMDSLENKKADVEKSLMEIKIKTSKDISMDDISSLKF